MALDWPMTIRADRFVRRRGEDDADADRDGEDQSDDEEGDVETERVVE
jgi:hypothetical protein